MANGTTGTQGLETLLAQLLNEPPAQAQPQEEGGFFAGLLEGLAGTLGGAARGYVQGMTGSDPGPNPIDELRKRRERRSERDRQQADEARARKIDAASFALERSDLAAERLSTEQREKQKRQQELADEERERRQQLADEKRQFGLDESAADEQLERAKTLATHEAGLRESTRTDPAIREEFGANQDLIAQAVEGVVGTLAAGEPFGDKEIQTLMLLVGSRLRGDAETQELFMFKLAQAIDKAVKINAPPERTQVDEATTRATPGRQLGAVASGAGNLLEIPGLGGGVDLLKNLFSPPRPTGGGDDAALQQLINSFPTVRGGSR